MNISDSTPSLNCEYNKDGPYTDQSFDVNNMSIIFLDQPGVEINNFLITPRTPDRMGKNNTERQTFIISSTPYRAAEELKAEKKKLEESLKEDRKNVRLENKKKREEKAIIVAKRKLTKQQQQTGKKRKVTKLSGEMKATKSQSADIFKNITNSPKKPCDKIIPKLVIKTVGATTSVSTKDKIETPNVRVKDNIEQLSTQKNVDLVYHKRFEVLKESHIRTLLFSGNEPDDDISCCDQENILSGLCFECGGQISTQKKGVECTKCANLYHESCIPKTFFNETLAKCPKCHNQL